MATRTPRVHFAEPGQRFALCGRRSARRTNHIQLTTCALCRELHRQRAAAPAGKRRRLWS